MKVTNIKWDIDIDDLGEGELEEIQANLPTEIEIPKDIEKKWQKFWIDNKSDFSHAENLSDLHFIIDHCCIIILDESIQLSMHHR